MIKTTVIVGLSAEKVKGCAGKHELEDHNEHKVAHRHYR